MLDAPAGSWPFENGPPDNQRNADGERVNRVDGGQEVDWVDKILQNRVEALRGGREVPPESRTAMSP
jgi:hypothetical protein